MQGINPFPATQRGTEEGEPKKETQRRKGARTQREEKRKEKREKIGREMSKEEQGRHPRCRHLATRLKLHPEPTNDSSRTLPPFPHPLSYTLCPTLPYPTLPYPTPSSLCAFASLRLCVQFFPLRLCVQFLPFASLRLTSNLSSSSKSVSTCRYLLSIGRAAITASTSPSCNLRNKFAVVSSWTTTFALGNCEPMASGFRSLTW